MAIFENLENYFFFAGTLNMAYVFIPDIKKRLFKRIKEEPEAREYFLSIVDQCGHRASDPELKKARKKFDDEVIRSFWKFKKNLIQGGGGNPGDASAPDKTWQEKLLQVWEDGDKEMRKEKLQDLWEKTFNKKMQEKARRLLAAATRRWDDARKEFGQNLKGGIHRLLGPVSVVAGINIVLSLLSCAHLINYDCLIKWITDLRIMTACNSALLIKAVLSILFLSPLITLGLIMVVKYPKERLRKSALKSAVIASLMDIFDRVNIETSIKFAPQIEKAKIDKKPFNF